ncbi:MAG: sugar ABC transporter substrate-binding protein [Firmicutes bacterium]|nr:sugar ABC transporter substrate-binding protein [Bacillota bacterium]
MNHFKFKKRLFLLLLAFVLSFSPGNVLRVGSTDRTRPIIISIVPKSLDNPMLIEAKEAAELTAERLNVKLEWVGPFKVDVHTQIKIIEGLIRRKVDGIAVSCSDAEQLRPVIDKAVAAGIKVATMEADAPESNRLFYCGTNNYAAGAKCGEVLVRIVTAKGWADRELNTVILTGSTKAHDLNERIRGFQEAAVGRLKLNYRTLLICNEDTTTAAKEVEAYLKKHPETDVLFFTGGWAFLGPPETLPVYDQWCQNGGITVAMDTSYPVLQAALRGFAQALVGPDYRKMGEFTVSYLVCAIKDLPIPSDFIDTGFELADESNFSQLLQTKKPWDIK